jgi:methylamine dehydrogenase heavy chain
MRASPLLSAAFLGLAFATGALAVPPPLPSEQVTIEHLPPRSPHWVFVFDATYFNEIDARVHLFDGDSYRELGQIDAGYLPGVNLSPDAATTVVATTYFARGSRGARTDVVEFTDNATLAVSGEIVLPSKLGQAVPSLFNVAYSADGHQLYASYLTPAASFGVLDPIKRTVLGEIDTAGCMLVIPSGSYRVSSLCESGRMLTVTLDGAGHEVTRAMSEPFFDADRDPIFAQGIALEHGYLFLSFLGEVHEVDLSGPQPVFAAPWSLLSPAQLGHWRPGAQQVGAVQRALGRLYVPMHFGGEDTHKDGGTQIWVYDLATHKRLARWPMPAGLSRAVALQVSQDAAPLLFVATEHAQLLVFDARSGQLRHTEPHIAQTPWMLLTP